MNFRILTTISLLMVTLTKTIYCEEIIDKLNCFDDESDTVCNNKEPVNKRESLIFTTPWNKIGYQYTERFAQRLEIISPVWFYIEHNLFQGRQDIKPDYIKNLRDKNPKIKIIPRFYIKLGDKSQDQTKWILNSQNLDYVLNNLNELAQEYKFDGYVLDWPIFNYYKIKKSLKFFLDKWQEHLGHLKNIVVFHGDRINHSQDLEEIKLFSQLFYRILICAYDFAGEELAPMRGIDQNIRFYKDAVKELNLSLNQFMIGLQFYGYLAEIKNRKSTQVDFER